MAKHNPHNNSETMKKTVETLLGAAILCLSTGVAVIPENLWAGLSLLCVGLVLVAIRGYTKAKK